MPDFSSTSPQSGDSIESFSDAYGLQSDNYTNGRIRMISQLNPLRSPIMYTTLSFAPDI